MKLSRIKLVAGLLAIGLTVAAFTQPLHAAERTISVTGMGSVNVEPDIAHVTLGVETRGAELSQAQASNSTLVDSVIAALRDQGIAESDMQTIGFSVWPMSVPHVRIFDPFFDGTMPPEEREYVVTNNIRVTIRDINAMGTVLSAALDAGANVTGGVNFAIQDSTAAYNRALALAMQNAAAKAQAIAGNLDVTLSTSPISVEEQGGMFMPISEQWVSMDMGGMGMGRALSAAAPVPMLVGELSVRAHVQVTYTFD